MINFIDFINLVLQSVLSEDFYLLTLLGIEERILSCSDWHLLLFDWRLLVSLVVYFALFYFVFFVLMYLPFKLFKRLVGQK